MQKLIKEIKPFILSEYYRASNQCGLLNHSDHESAALLAEEVQELQDEFTSIFDSCRNFWNFIKTNASDNEKRETLHAVQTHAILAACEAIQVAAMAYKAEQTIINRGEQK